MEKTVFKNQRVLVVGLAKSGVSVAKLLSQMGAFVTVNDFKAMEENPEAQELVGDGLRVITGHHPLELLEEDFAYVVKNPGIPYTNPLIAKALEKGLPIYTEVEVAYHLLKGDLLAITGSNGKTTTTTLTSLMLKNAFLNARVMACGNIGIPLSELALQSTQSDKYVIELSSFQLMGIEIFRPKIAAILNIYSAHLDYHHTREAYIDAKIRITMNQTEDDFLVYNADSEEVEELVLTHSKANLIPFSRLKESTTGAYVKGEAIFFKGEKIFDLSIIKIPGVQNIENILAATAMAKLAGATNEAIISAVENFYGVKHRTQFVKEVNTRRFYNDSKATNIVATQTALNSFKQDSIVLIAGGLDRGNEFDGLVPAMKNVRVLIVYGQSKEKLVRAGQLANTPVIHSVNSLAEATQLAYELSEENEVVLLSPACASWDQYKNFEIRGDEFITLVEGLA